MHAPHTPCSQPRWVPVSPQRSRRKSASVRRGGHDHRTALAVDADVDGDLTHGGPPRAAADHASAIIAAPTRRRYAAEPWRSDGTDVERGRSRGRPPRAASTSAIGAPTTASSAALARCGVGAETEEPDAAATDAIRLVELDGDRGPGDGEVAVAAGELARRRTRDRPDRTGNDDGGEQLVVGDRRRPEAGEELGGGDGPDAAGRADLELGVERQRHGGVLGGRVGVGQRPADGAPVADLEVADQRASPGRAAAPTRRPRSSARSAAWVVMAPIRSCEPDRSIPRSSSSAADVDQVLERGEPQRQHRHEALAAGQQLGAVAELGERRDGLRARSPAGGTRTGAAFTTPPR